MGRRAVGAFGKANGAGAVGSEEELDMTGETPKPGTSQEQTPQAERSGVVVGGPADTSQQEPPAFKFKYGNREFNSQEELETYLTELDGQITSLRSRPTEPPVVVQPPAAPRTDGPKNFMDMKDEDLVAEILSNPKAVLGAIRQDVRNEVAQQQQSQKNIETMWNNFWDKNKDLKPFEQTVKMVFDANMPVLGPLKMEDVPAKLAELSRSTILSINKDALKPRSSGGQRAMVEGGDGAPVERRVETPPAAQPRSLSAVLKARSQTRQKARATATA